MNKIYGLVAAVTVFSVVTSFPTASQPAAEITIPRVEVVQETVTPTRLDVGRFIPLVPKTDEPLSYHVTIGTECVQKLLLPVGGVYSGIRYDSKPGTLHSNHTFSTAKGPVCVVLGILPGNVTLEVWGNGKVPGESPRLLGIYNFTVGQLPIPPPVDPPIVPPTDPTDPLFPALKVAFIADGSPAQTSKKLGELYRTAARVTVYSGSVQTLGDLYNDVSKTAAVIAPFPSGERFREVIAVELDKTLGRSKSAPINRDLARDQFNRIAGLLEALK